MTCKDNVIAIDGPAASGKGTLARNLAEKLDYAYLDTGKLYRVVGWRVLRDEGDPGDETTAVKAARDVREVFSLDMLGNPDLTRDDVGEAASKVSVFPEVRAALLALQQDFAAEPPAGRKGAVLDGRDIGTVVCPNAKVKLFVIADTEVRAERRYKELQSKGIDVTYEAVLADMRKRDARDSGRAAAPLKPADDAVILDTSTMDPDEVLEKALEIVHSA